MSKRRALLFTLSSQPFDLQVSRVSLHVMLNVLMSGTNHRPWTVLKTLITETLIRETRVRKALISFTLVFALMPVFLSPCHAVVFVVSRFLLSLRPPESCGFPTAFRAARFLVVLHSRAPILHFLRTIVDLKRSNNTFQSMDARRKTFRFSVALVKHCQFWSLAPVCCTGPFHLPTRRTERGILSPLYCAGCVPGFHSRQTRGICKQEQLSEKKRTSDDLSLPRTFFRGGQWSALWMPTLQISSTRILVSAHKPSASAAAILHGNCNP